METCRLQVAIGEALTAFLDTMAAYCLSDLLVPSGELRQLLGVPDSGVATRAALR